MEMGAMGIFFLTFLDFFSTMNNWNVYQKLTEHLVKM